MKLSGIFVPKKTATCIKEMYRRREADKRVRILGQQRIRLFAVIIGISIAVAIPVASIDAGSASEPVKDLRRNEYGGGERAITLTAKPEGFEKEKITVSVSERRYSDKEISEFSKRFDEVIWDTISGENTDPGHVLSDLSLPDHIKGLPFDIEWSSDEPLLIGRGGVINKERPRQGAVGVDFQREGPPVRLHSPRNGEVRPE